MEIKNLKKENFVEFDVRPLKGNFLLAIIKKAKDLDVGEGIKVIQNFEPIPLYTTMKNMGFDAKTIKQADGVYSVYFSRTEIKEGEMIQMTILQLLLV